ncbi:hypothetical protein [Flavobacterium sp.]|uniref:hypothetical protein n=1 Tax=Flavobacterium sp. TaxID=239 RepID=UPI00374DCC39
MKKILLIIVISIFSQNLLAQQNVGINGNSNWTNLWTNFTPKTTDYKEANEILFGNITENKTLYKKNIYLLSGVVCVKNNAILTIEPGTVIRGDIETVGTLVITKNSKLIANGIETDPIVFTSNNEAGNRRAGDWGGIVIYGDAPTNAVGGFSNLDFLNSSESGIYGGSNVDSDSGILNFVRIEFAGKRVNSEKQFNALSIAGVGKKTILNNIQVSFSDDDSFECLGGNVFLNNLVSYRATDDDFDFTQGTQATISNSLALRNPFNSGVEISRCLEISSYDKKENTDFSKKPTAVLANNLSLINYEENSNGLVKEAIYIKESASLKLQNSLVYGFAEGIILDNKIGVNDEVAKKIIFDNVEFISCKLVAKFESLDKELVFNNQTISNLPQTQLFKESSFKKNVDFRMKTTSSFAYNK